MCDVMGCVTAGRKVTRTAYTQSIHTEMLIACIYVCMYGWVCKKVPRYKGNVLYGCMGRYR